MEIQFSIVIRIVSLKFVLKQFSFIFFLSRLDRQHVLDCLPRVWMCDGVFVSSKFKTSTKTICSNDLLATERNQVDDFFTQSSLTAKPVVKFSTG